LPNEELLGLDGVGAVGARHRSGGGGRPRHRLLDLYREKFGDHIPLIRRQDVKGFLERKSLWLARPLGLEKVRAQAELMEAESKRFYQRAARQSTDAATRQLLGDLANPAPLDASGGPVDNDVEQYGLRSG
jgi:hypothetical protein